MCRIPACMKCDMHMHTRYSHDSNLEPRKILKIAKKRGIDAVAITDHGTIKGGLAVKKEAISMNIAVSVIVGAEILTERGEIIGLFLEEEVKSTSFERVIDEIKAQNGIVVVPHPFDDLRGSALHPTSDDASLFDCVEVFNSRCIFRKFNEKALEFANSHNLGMTAGSDAHTANEIGNAFVSADVDDIWDLREAVLRREVSIYGKKSLIFNHLFSKILRELRA